jgi:hypothetical protein
MSERPYTIRPYRPGDEHGILALFNQVFGEGDPAFVPRTLAEWRWLFAENPWGNQIVVAVEHGGPGEPSGRVIAHYCCLPARAQVGAEVVIAGQGIDSMVHADYRRGLKREGAFLLTAQKYFAEFGHWPICGFGYGFPNRKAYPIGVRLIGYQPIVKPLPTLYRNFFESDDDDAVGRAHQDAADVVEVPDFGGAVAPELDALWARLRPQFQVALVRDAQYLRWRYDGCPWLGHRKFLIREKAGAGAKGGALRAFFVTRSNWQKLPIQALVDYLGAPDDAASLALALRTTTRVARASGQARVETWLPERLPFFQHALAAGMKSEPCQYVLCTMLYREEPALDWMRDRWYFTIGDSDVV